ncbi:T9SS type A sorting domain-containing protein [Hymenobacter sp. PAMC 26628]|uniref:T9SS type A sorting domain-containing protein n=1 Tax=Hymenobacter sp. PAMC 26628 TaxID=1484118 RepID=UPI0009E6AEBF|nr:T9SS type A sorting domain-containing protein [Hymenobacter sp. PAMC 26628]
MKHPYSPLTSWLRWLCLCFLLAMPGLGMAQTVTLTPNTAGDPQDFGSVSIGTMSTSKAYTVSGSGVPTNGSISVGIPNMFEGSIDNNTFSPSAIVLTPDAGGNVPNTAIYLRFKPTTTGAQPRTFRASIYDINGDLVTRTSGIALTGTGTPGSPTITVNPNALQSFGSQATNTSSSAKTVAVTGSSLTADITVAAPAGFLVSSDNTTYATTATLAQTGGTVNATLYVKFRPTAAGAYANDITLSSTNATNQTVSVSGTGVLPTPVLTVSSTTLNDFGSVVVGNTSANTYSFTVSGQDLQGNLTVTPPTGFRIRTGSNVFSTNAIVLTPTSGTLANTSIDVRFTPVAVQVYNAAVAVATPNGSGSVTQSVAVSGTGTAAPASATINVTPGAINFGTVTNSGSPNTLSFEVSGTNLTNDIVLTPSQTTILFRNVTAGGSFSSDPLTLVSTSGTVATQTIEVKLVPTVPTGNYTEVINLVSGTTATSSVSVMATNTSGRISDLSVSNPNNYSFTFATRPNSISLSQSFRVSGTNLVQDLTVAPSGPDAGYFQISTDNTNFVSSLTFARDANGNVPQQTVYVRFVPGNNALTVNAIIRSSSAPAPNGDVSVTGISQPTIRLSQVLQAFPNNVVVGTTTDPKPIRLEGFLLGGNVDYHVPNDTSDPTRNPSGTPQFEFSLDNGATYITSTTVTPDATTGNFSQDLLVRFRPVRVGNAAQELEFRNPSFSNGQYFVLPSGNGRVSGFAIATEPSQQSTAIIYRNPGSTNATVQFRLANPDPGKAFGQNRLVIVTPYYDMLPVNLFPQDKQNFDPGTTDANGAYQFGTGTAIEAATNTYVVFSGASGSFTMTNLDPTATYKVYAFEYNNDGVLAAENYLVPNNQPLAPLPVELLSFTAQLRNKQVNLNWVTASEKNSRSFDVQRSSNGQTFTTVLTKAAQGNTSARTTYDAVDRQPLPGVSYYRLKQIDIDGKVAYSPTLSVQNDGAVDITIYPNPTAGKVTITLPAALAASAPRVRISDLMGRVVQEVSLPASGEIDLAGLPVGTYLLNVGGQQVRSRVVKY